MRKWAIILFFGLLFACSDDNPTQPGIDSSLIPLKIGNMWVYENLFAGSTWKDSVILTKSAQFSYSGETITAFYINQTDSIMFYSNNRHSTTFGVTIETNNILTSYVPIIEIPTMPTQYEKSLLDVEWQANEQISYLGKNYTAFVGKKTYQNNLYELWKIVDKIGIVEVLMYGNGNLIYSHKLISHKF